MPSEAQSASDPVMSRIIVSNALAALVAAQADWSTIHGLEGPERQILEQWATKAKVDLGNPDARSRIKLLDIANNALVSVALGSAPVPPQADDKLGSLGLLSPKLYNVELPPYFKETIRQTGLTKKHVSDTVHQPDAHQHLSPPNDFLRGAEPVSFFVRLLNRAQVVRDGNPAQWCLVLGKRLGRKIRVDDAFLVFQDSLNISGGSPLDLFQRFCEVYGLNLLLNGKHVGKLVTYAVLERGGTGLGPQAAPKGHKIGFAGQPMVTEDGVALFVIAYAIDLTVYEQDIRRHRTQLG